MPIHCLWLAYIAELFNLSEKPEGGLDDDKLPQAAMMHGKLVKADFHGAIITGMYGHFSLTHAGPNGRPQ